MPRPLALRDLKKEAVAFAKSESAHDEPSLFDITDGKAVGTYLEHKFQESLQDRYEYARGSSAKGIDFPKLGVDIKVTSIRQPQSSCPFKSARQKVYGLGYRRRFSPHSPSAPPMIRSAGRYRVPQPLPPHHPTFHASICVTDIYPIDHAQTRHSGQHRQRPAGDTQLLHHVQTAEQRACVCRGPIDQLPVALQNRPRLRRVLLQQFDTKYPRARFDK